MSDIKYPEDFAHCCEVVEKYCRMVGKDCQVIFESDGVEIALLEWPGSAVCDNLAEAIKEANKDYR